MALFERSVNAVLGAMNTENLPSIGIETATIKVETLTSIEDLPALASAMNNSNTVTKTQKGPKNFTHNDQENSSGKSMRRLDFANVSMSLHRTKNNSMQRRNARERNRVRYLNMTFEVLRQHLPFADTTPKSKNKKMSKVDTLRGAIDYIRDLQNMLEDSDAVDAALKGCDPTSTAAFMESQLLSPGGSLSPSGSSNTVSEDGITSEEDSDLLDVHTWFAC